MKNFFLIGAVASWGLYIVWSFTQYSVGIDPSIETKLLSLRTQDALIIALICTGFFAVLSHTKPE